MSRRRYLSTDISTDTRVNRLATMSGDFAVMLYTWMIPHCADDATISGDPEALLLSVIPGRRDKSAEDIAAALDVMDGLGLIDWDRDEQTINFPAQAFYRYQTYIPDGKRRGANNGAKPHETAPNAEESQPTPQNADDQRKTAQNSAYPSPSVSPSPSLSPSPSGVSTDTPPRKRVRATKATFTAVPDDLVAVVPEEVWDEIGKEQGLTDKELRFETAKMLDHYRGNAERKADWVASWRSWMRSPYRLHKQSSTNGHAPPGRTMAIVNGQRNLSSADLRRRAMGEPLDEPA